MIKFKCPNCEKRFNVSNQHIGRTVKCNKCEHRFKVPGTNEAHPVGESTSIKKTHASGQPEKKIRRQQWMPIAISFGLGLLVVCAFIFVEKQSAENPESNPSQNAEPGPSALVVKDASSQNNPGNKKVIDNKTHGTVVADKAVLTIVRANHTEIKRDIEQFKNGSPEEQINKADRWAVKGDYQLAVVAFEHIFENNPQLINADLGFHFACVYIKFGEHENHERLCKWLFERFSFNENEEDCQKVVSAYLLYPNVNNEELSGKAVAWIKQGLENNNASSWWHINQGMSQYRMGDYASANKWLEKETQNTKPKCIALAFTAMVEHSNGNSTLSFEALTKARTELTLYQFGNENKLGAKLALGEAEALMQLPFTAFDAPSIWESHTADNLLDKSFYNQSKEQQFNTALVCTSNYEYARSAQAYEYLFDHYPKSRKPHTTVGSAMVYLILGQYDKHETLSGDMFKAIAYSDLAHRSCLLSWRINNNPRLSKIIKITSQKVKSAGSKNNVEKGNIYLNHGIASYRMKRYSDAIEYLEKVSTHSDRGIECISLSYMALVEHERGNQTRSNELINQAREIAFSFNRINPWQGFPIGWTNILSAKVAFFEANGVIERGMNFRIE